MHPVFLRLRDLWQAGGVRFRPGLAQEAIETWERAAGLRLTDELRSYYLVVDGMEPADFGPEMIRFWPLHETVCLGTEWGDAPKSLEAPDRYFIFADGMIDAWHYAYRLPEAPGTPGPVIQFSGDILRGRRE